MALLAPVLDDSRRRCSIRPASSDDGSGRLGRDVRGRLAAVSAVAERTIPPSVRADDRAGPRSGECPRLRPRHSRGNGARRELPRRRSPSESEQDSRTRCCPSCRAGVRQPPRQTGADHLGRRPSAAALQSAAANAAGNGADAAAASRRVAQALVDTGRALTQYADGLHRTMMTSCPAADHDAVSGAPGRLHHGRRNVCPICLEIEAEKPLGSRIPVTVPPGPLQLPVPPRAGVDGRPCSVETQ